MESVLTLAQQVSSVMKKYVTASFNAKLYYTEDPTTGIYSVIVVPSQPNTSQHIMLLAQVSETGVTILTDTTDHPLEDALLQAGISRAKVGIAHRAEPSIANH